MANTFYWHDYETFGADPSRDRPSQFAGLRTDEDLNPIGDPLVIYCQPQPDILPSPQACLITGITPQVALENGLPEPQFIELIHRQLSQPNTCGVGYNSIRFDDEVSRYCLYRNFYDPYQREWQYGNSRWDILDMLRLTRALRPDGIQWTDHSDGKPSFKLEHLTAANNIDHASAHDALSDVTATIAMAKLIKQKQPKLFDYVVNHRGKPAVASLLNLNHRSPFLHVSGMLPSNNMYCAIMMPLAKHPTNNNGIICVDLAADPNMLIDLDAEQIRRRVFTSADNLGDDESRIPLKVVHLNKAPVVATHKLVDPLVAERLGLNVESCEQHWGQLLQMDVSDKLQEVFSAPDYQPKIEAEQRLYEGFLPNSDRQILEEVRKATAADFQQQRYQFADQRYNELLLSYRARYFNDTLTGEERASWRANCRWRLYDESSGYLTIEQLFKEIDVLLSAEDLAPQKADILQSLKRWGKQVDREFAPTH
jgi:exodeoxyribonuclease-1